MDLTNFYISLEIMWKGMAGIFTVLILIALIIWLLFKVTSGKKN